MELREPFEKYWGFAYENGQANGDRFSNFPTVGDFRYD
jgi:hypothetical protein